MSIFTVEILIHKRSRTVESQNNTARLTKKTNMGKKIEPCLKGAWRFYFFIKNPFPLT